MEEELLVNKQRIKSKNRQITVAIALFLNEELFSEKRISYQVYKKCEEALLKKEKQTTGK